MLEPVKTEEQNQGTDETQQDTGGDGADVRKHPAFVAVTKQLSELKAALDEREAKAKAAEEAAARKKLEEEGNYKALTEKLNADFAAKEAAYKANERRLLLEARLAGVDELVRDGLIARCPSDSDVEAYVTEARQKYPHVFEPKPVISESEEESFPPKMMSGGRSGSGQTKSLEERLKNADPAAQREAFEKALRGR